MGRRGPSCPPGSRVSRLTTSLQRASQCTQGPVTLRNPQYTRLCDGERHTGGGDWGTRRSTSPLLGCLPVGAPLAPQGELDEVADETPQPTGVRVLRDEDGPVIVGGRAAEIRAPDPSTVHASPAPEGDARKAVHSPERHHRRGSPPWWSSPIRYRPVHVGTLCV